jgi:hypothetical protein
MLVRPMPATTRSKLTRPLYFLFEKAEQVDLVFVARCVVGVAAFGWIGDVGAAVPDEQALAEAGSGGDEGAVADLAGVAFSERINLLGRKLGDAVSVGLEVIDEEDVLNIEAGGELAAIEGPGKVGEAQAAVADRAWNAEAGGGDFFCAEKVFDDDFEAGIILGFVDLVACGFQLAVGKVIQPKVDLGAAYISRQDHLSLSKNPQPSPLVAGKSAAAALSRISVSIPLEGQMS